MGTLPSLKAFISSAPSLRLRSTSFERSTPRSSSPFLPCTNPETHLPNPDSISDHGRHRRTRVRAGAPAQEVCHGRQVDRLHDPGRVDVWRRGRRARQHVLLPPEVRQHLQCPALPGPVHHAHHQPRLVQQYLDNPHLPRRLRPPPHLPRFPRLHGARDVGLRRRHLHRARSVLGFELLHQLGQVVSLRRLVQVVRRSRGTRMDSLRSHVCVVLHAHRRCLHDQAQASLHARRVKRHGRLASCHPQHHHRLGCLFNWRRSLLPFLLPRRSGSLACSLSIAVHTDAPSFSFFHLDFSLPSSQTYIYICKS